MIAAVLLLRPFSATIPSIWKWSLQDGILPHRFLPWWWKRCANVSSIWNVIGQRILRRWICRLSTRCTNVPTFLVPTISTLVVISGISSRTNRLYITKKAAFESGFFMRFDRDLLFRLRRFQRELQQREPLRWQLLRRMPQQRLPRLSWLPAQRVSS